MNFQTIPVPLTIPHIICFISLPSWSLTPEDVVIYSDFLYCIVKLYLPCIIHEQSFKNIKTKSCIYPFKKLHLVRCSTSFQSFKMSLELDYIIQQLFYVFGFMSSATLMNMLSTKLLKKKWRLRLRIFLQYAIRIPSTLTLSHLFVPNSVVTQPVTNLSVLRLVTNISVHLTQVRSGHIL